MGKIDITRPQQEILTIIASEPYLQKTFYFTGGTALAGFYLHHRESEDIDLFTEKSYDQEFVRNWMEQQRKARGWKLEYAQVFERQTYEISWKKHQVKIEFVHYPYRRLEKSTFFFKGISVDSKGDIAVNKLLTISQRTTTKDYVDLYFLLKKDFTYWDLMHGAKKKFGMEIEPLFGASLFTKVEEFDTLPIMRKPLTLKQLKDFFLKEARKQGMKFVKP